MDVGTVLSVAQSLFAALQCSELKAMCSILGYQSQLDDLQRTVSTVRAVLRDAETKQELSHEAQLWIQELKKAVYDADDLLDEFTTLAEQKHLMKGDKASKKVRHFFSRLNPLGVAYNMSQGVKKIRKKLDAIAINHTQFGFSVDSQPIRRRREETCSYVYQNNIIGREDEVEKIVSLLLDSNNLRDISFLPIVGMGGLGKTSLAQLVYNDARVVSAFPLRMWTCISDHGQEQLDVEGLLRKILASATSQPDEGSTMDQIQSQLRQKLASNKYLLVLDDVWTENRNHWLKLVEFLLGGQSKSWIMVTTRSQETARIIGGGPIFELKGLSKENSWRLFMKTAFGSEQSNPNDDLVKIGLQIVEGCAAVPLAIRVAGSLLYGQDKSTWLQFQEIGLCSFKKRQNDIMPILELSYHQLESPLKSCFTYCALFPKDYEIKKELLISLWMAQGFIIPFDDGQTIEDAAEEYFSILLRRCFFQDVKHDVFGGIKSCKIHDLMHDIAQTVAAKEISVTNCVTIKIDERVRHLGHTRSTSASYHFTKTHIRSYIRVCDRYYNSLIKMDQISCEALIANWTCLRALDLSYSDIKSLPDSIGELLHLRYLDLSWNHLDLLPKSITKLHNLQSLILCGNRFKELPNDMSKLVKLRVLDTDDSKLTYMPSDMRKLTCLHTLTMFAVDDASLSWKTWFDQLEQLKDLTSLKGYICLRIGFPNNATKIKEGDRREGAYLRNKEHLNDIQICLGGREDIEEEIRLMEKLQPHPNLMGLNLTRCNGVRMPSWFPTSLPNLTRLILFLCKVEYLTCLGNLPHLKVLQLHCLENLEYIIETKESAVSNEQRDFVPSGLPIAEELSLFPSLQKLVLVGLPKLKGWSWRSAVGDNDQLIVDAINSIAPLPLPLPFPQLKSMSIEYCPNLISILLCPMLEKLHLRKFNERLQIKISADNKVQASGSSTPSSTLFSNDITMKLRKVTIDNVAYLKLFPEEAFQCLKDLKINYNMKLESLGEVREVFQICSSSLKFLSIYDCPNLRSIVSGALEHLTALENLSIILCPKVSLSAVEETEEYQDSGVPWQSFHHSLRCLTLVKLPKLVNLPNWMQHLVALQIFSIQYCPVLESLPNWMPKLTSLKELDIAFCPRLTVRGQNSTGEDWPHIQHIPSRNFC